MQINQTCQGHRLLQIVGLTILLLVTATSACPVLAASRKPQGCSIPVIPASNDATAARQALMSNKLSLCKCQEWYGSFPEEEELNHTMMMTHAIQGLNVSPNLEAVSNYTRSKTWDNNPVCYRTRSKTVKRKRSDVESVVNCKRCKVNNRLAHELCHVSSPSLKQRKTKSRKARVPSTQYNQKRSKFIWSSLPPQLIYFTLTYLSTKDLLTCRVLDKRTATIINEGHLLPRAFWRCHPHPSADALSRAGYENRISHQLKQRTFRSRNKCFERRATTIVADSVARAYNQKISWLDAQKNHINFHKILFYTIYNIKKQNNSIWEKVKQVKHGGSVRSIAFSHDNQYLVSASNDMTVRILSSQNGSWQKIQQVHHDDEVTSAVFSMDSQYLVTTSVNGTVRIMTLQSGVWQDRQRIDFGIWVWSATFSRDGKYLVIALKDINRAHILSLQSGTWQEIQQVQHNHEVIPAVFSPDNQFLVITPDYNTASILACQKNHTWQEINKIQPEQGYINSATFSPDSLNLVLTFTDTIFYILDRQDDHTWQVTHRVNHHNHSVQSAAFNPDSTELVTASYDKTAVTMIRQGSRSWKKAQCIRHNDLVYSAAFSSDGLNLMTHSCYSTIRVLTRERDGTWQNNRVVSKSNYIKHSILSPDSLSLVTMGDQIINIYSLRISSL